MSSKELITLSRGFVYCWIHTTGKKYIGSHNGSNYRTYIGSGKLFRLAYNKSPAAFTRIILYVGPDFRDVEEKLLRTLLADVSSEFYNLTLSTTNPALRGHNHPSWGRKTPHTAETKEKISAAALKRLPHTRTGHVHSDETKEKLRMAALKRPYHACTDEAKKKIGDKNRGRIRSIEERKKISESRSNVPKVLCPYCNRSMDPAHAARYHFDRCKEKN